MNEAAPQGARHGRGGIQARLGAAYATYFLALGIQIPYLPLWFQHQGLGPEAIGVALAVPMVTRLVATPVLGFLSDRLGRPKAVLCVLSVLTAAGMAALAVSGSALAIFIVLGLMAMSWYPGLSLLDSYTSRQARAGRGDYGRARQWGSGSFLVANLVGGWLVGAAGAGAVVVLMFAGQLTHVGATFALPELPRGARQSALLSGRTARLGLLAGILAAALVQASHAQLYAFASVHWAKQGYSLATIGLLWAAGVAAEMVMFRFGSRLVVRFGPHLLIVAGGVTAVARFAALSADPPLALLLPLQVLHAFTFGATYLGTVELIARSVSEHRAGTGQTAASWTSGVAMAGANLASGPLWAAFGPSAFLVSCGIAAAGALLAIAAARLQPHTSASGG